jgi:hypothetical protein
MSFARGGNAGYDTYSTGPEYPSFTTYPASMKAGVFLKCLTVHPGLFSCSQLREDAPGRAAETVKAKS